MTTQAWARMPLMHPVVKDALEATAARIHSQLGKGRETHQIAIYPTSQADWLRLPNLRSICCSA